MKDMMIGFIEEVLGAKDEAEFEAMQERMMDGAYAEEFRAFVLAQI